MTVLHLCNYCIRAVERVRQVEQQLVERERAAEVMVQEAQQQVRQAQESETRYINSNMCYNI